MSDISTNGVGEHSLSGEASIENQSEDRLDVRGLVDGKCFLVYGGTGFLGKVWLCALLYHYPEVEHVYLVVRQRKKADGTIRQTSEQRFWDEVATSEAFSPLQERYPGAAYDTFMRERVTPIPGDVTEPYAGVPEDVRKQLRGKLHALVNASGVVDFNPPLDYALNVNAFGMQNLVALAEDLSPKKGEKLAFLHTSTCYVAGDRTGEVREIDPLEFPFPRAEELDRSHWDPEREIAECVDLVENVRHRSNDAFRQSAFLDTAKKNLKDRKEPARGQSLQTEFQKVKRKFEEQQLVDWGTERAQFWGWHNIYTYTKSIGEQILRVSDLPHTIVRPAIIESALKFPKTGWCEGINTAAPLIHMAVKGPVHFPMEEDSILDFIPVDQVAYGMMLALAELLEGRAKVVYQYGTSDSAPVKVSRIIELLGLYKRDHYLYEAGGNPVLNWVNSRLEPKAVSADQYLKRGPRWQSEKVKSAAGMLGKLSGAGPMKALTGSLSKELFGLSRQLDIQARITDQFLPFMATHSYRFCCRHTREAYARLDVHDQELLPWRPEEIDWRHYMLEIQCPGVTQNVSPQIEAKLRKELQPLRRHDHLLALVDEMAERHDLAPALLRTHEDGFSRVSFRELRGRTIAVAIRLAKAGVKPGDRVLISGKNCAEWPIAYFGILRAGGVAVPLDPALSSEQVEVICRSAQPTAAILDAEAVNTFGTATPEICLDIVEVSGMGAVGELPRFELEPESLASILYTSGTTGDPKGVMLSHANFCSVLASLGKLFPLRETDRVLSVLPLHHAFEFTCGMLLPLSMGARIIYLDEINADRLSYGLREGRVTCMVGVPALWQLLERRIRNQVKERGQIFELAFDGGLELNRRFGRATGMDLGRLMFGSVHSRFGGNIRMLISGGAALPSETQKLFSGLGLAMSEGYGLTEAAPVLTVALPKPGGEAGNVGEPIPGVEIRIEGADESGVGEVWARGQNVMHGYFGQEDATSAVLESDGWLKTGDMGRLDHKGRLVLVGRAKEVVVTAAGENIYLDDVENTLGTIPMVEEYSLVGVSDPRGGERLGMLAVPEERTTGDRRAHHKRVRDSIKDAIAELQPVMRPTVVHLVESELPRTATRKVQRKKVQKTLEKNVSATPGKGYTSGEGISGPVVRAIAAVAGVDASEIQTSTNLKEKYGFDSLMWVELSASLETVGTGRPDPQILSECETVSDVVTLVGAEPDSALLEGPVEDEEIHLPDFVSERLKAGMSQVQKAFNGGLLNTTIKGRAFIPQNRQVIVVSNHSSHLDMGLVKHALGPYGKDIAALAAKDYFFEGNKWKVAWFRHLTNVEPLDRRSGFRTSMKQAKEVIDSGRVVLIFPEGTRQTSGQLAEFKPMVGILSLETGVDILPMWIDGAYESMPKGALVPRKRGIEVRIGPPLRIDDLERLTEGLRKTQAARRVANIAHEAVDRLRKGEVLDLASMEDAPIVELSTQDSPEDLAKRVFTDLNERYDAARIERPLSWYFALGPKGGPRWTVMVDKKKCTIQPGRPPEGKADCVVKTSADIFTRIVKEAYVPEPQQFISGAIKTNDIPLLIEFSRVFNLAEGG